MLNSALNPQEQALIPHHISTVTDALIVLCSRPQPYAYTAIEKLWGRPMTILPEHKKQKTRAQILDDLLVQLQSRRGVTIDTRRFKSVIPNPRRGKIGARYAIIREGMTVGEYLDKGGRTRDLVKGVRRGHFTLEDD